jgi:hypothetical protein
MRTLWVVLAIAACGGSQKPAMGPPPSPAKISDNETAEPVQRAQPQVASDPEEGGQGSDSAARMAQSTPAGGGTVTPESPTVSGDIDRDGLQQVFKGGAARLRYCYEKQLMRNPALAGRLVVTFTVETGGRVSDAVVDGPDHEVDQCVAAAVKTWEFPNVRSPVKIVYPFVLSPR